MRGSLTQVPLLRRTCLIALRREVGASVGITAEESALLAISATVKIGIGLQDKNVVGNIAL